LEATTSDVNKRPGLEESRQGTINEQPRDGHSELFCCFSFLFPLLSSPSHQQLAHNNQFPQKSPQINPTNKSLPGSKLSSAFLPLTRLPTFFSEPQHINQHAFQSFHRQKSLCLCPHPLFPDRTRPESWQGERPA